VCIYLTTTPNGLAVCRRGCMVGEGELPGADGINGTMKLWTDASHTRSVNVTCGTAPYICKSGASVSNFQGFFPPSSNASQRYPYGGPGVQSVDNMYANGARHSPGSNGGPISMFSGDQLPVKRASEFQSTDPLPSHTGCPSGPTTPSCRRRRRLLTRRARNARGTATQSSRRMSRRCSGSHRPDMY
jgi:hypothetical protein